MRSGRVGLGNAFWEGRVRKCIVELHLHLYLIPLYSAVLGGVWAVMVVRVLLKHCLRMSRTT